MVEVIGSSPTAPTNNKRASHTACSFVIGGDFGASTRRNQNLKSIAKFNAPSSVNLRSKFLPRGSRLRETAKPYRPTFGCVFFNGGDFGASTRRNRNLKPYAKFNAPSSVNLRSKFLPMPIKNKKNLAKTPQFPRFLANSRLKYNKYICVRLH